MGTLLGGRGCGGGSGRRRCLVCLQPQGSTYPDNVQIVEDMLKHCPNETNVQTKTCSAQSSFFLFFTHFQNSFVVMVHDIWQENGTKSLSALKTLRDGALRLTVTLRALTFSGSKHGVQINSISLTNIANPPTHTLRTFVSAAGVIRKKENATYPYAYSTSSTLGPEC